MGVSSQENKKSAAGTFGNGRTHRNYTNMKITCKRTRQGTHQSRERPTEGISHDIRASTKPLDHMGGGGGTRGGFDNEGARQSKVFRGGKEKLSTRECRQFKSDTSTGGA